MAYLRGQERFVYERVFSHLKERVTVGLSWDGSGLPPGQLPWGASTPLTWQEQVPDPKLETVAPNTVSFTEGRHPDESEEELGADGPGGLMSTIHTFFVDTYAENASIARALAGDIASVFRGRAPGASRYLSLKDYGSSGAPDAPGHLLRFEDVEVDFPAVGSTGKLRWAVVKVTCVHEWNA